MSKQDIEKRLGFAAQGVKAEFVSGGLSPSEMKENQRRIETNIRYEAGEMRNLTSNMRFIKDEIQRLTAEIKNTRDIKRKAQLSLKLDAENKRMKDQVLYLRRARQSIQENQADAKSLGITLDPKWAGNFARPGAKAEMGFLSRVGYAATALTADPADPKSPEYRKQVSEAKAAAKDAITNYKFMRDKVKERLAALDAYVTNAIKVINSATSAKDIEHYVEQLRIAVKSQSMILGASKSPFARPTAKAEMAKRMVVDTITSGNQKHELGYESVMQSLTAGEPPHEWFRPVVRTTNLDTGKSSEKASQPHYTEKSARDWLKNYASSVKPSTDPLYAEYASNREKISKMMTRLAQARNNPEMRQKLQAESDKLDARQREVAAQLQKRKSSRPSAKAKA